MNDVRMTMDDVRSTTSASCFEKASGGGGFLPGRLGIESNEKNRRVSQSFESRRVSIWTPVQFCE